MTVAIDPLEPLLAGLVRQQVDKLARAHPHESFYGFALDTNIAFGSVSCAANTRAALREHCLREYDDEGECEELQWQFGDWSYRDLNRGDADWERGWNEASTRIAALADTLCDENRDDEWDAWKESFLRMACRVLLRLEAAGGFAALPRDDDFRVCCADHDEAVESGERRMERVREQLALGG